MSIHMVLIILKLLNPGDPFPLTRFMTLAMKAYEGRQFCGLAGVLMNGVNIGIKIKEIVELIKEPDSDDQVLRIFKVCDDRFGDHG